ncbi:MAG: hypothetical protein R2845_12275 [Thermomicrobiales bacterium]
MNTTTLTHDNRESVAVGLHTTASDHHRAALIMVAVFSGSQPANTGSLQQVGFGLAVAVLDRRHDHPNHRRTGRDGAAWRSELVHAVMAQLVA